MRYGAKFPKNTRPAVSDEDISNNVTNVVRSKAEAVHTAKIADYQLFSAAECENWDFIPAVIEDTWVRELREPVTLYTFLSPSGLLAHLKVLRIGLHAIDVLALQNKMQHYNQNMKIIHEYVNTLKDA